MLSYSRLYQKTQNSTNAITTHSVQVYHRLIKSCNNSNDNQQQETLCEVKKEDKSNALWYKDVQDQNWSHNAPFLALMPLLPPTFVEKASRPLNPRQEQ